MTRPAPTAAVPAPAHGQASLGRRLEAGFERNRVAVLTGAAAAICLVAYLARRNNAATNAQAATDPSIAGTTTAGYDSTANDLYDAIQPQLEDLQTQINDLGPIPTTTPSTGSTSTPSKPAPVKRQPLPVSPITKVGNTIRRWPKPPTAPKKTPPKPTPKPASYYTVHKGDTLSGIAKKEGYGGNWRGLYNANKGVIGGNPNVIKPGQRLSLPKRGK